MGTIYSNAWCIFSWLGTPDKDLLNDMSFDVQVEPLEDLPIAAFDFIDLAKTLYLEIRKSEPDRRASDRKEKSRISALCKLLMLEPPERALKLNLDGPKNTIISSVISLTAWQQLAEICQNEYWLRMWVFQEGYLAKRLTLIYGTKCMEWQSLQIVGDLFSSTISRSIIDSEEPVTAGSKLVDWHIIRHSEAWRSLKVFGSALNRGTSAYDSLSLNDLVEMTLHEKSSDPRDKIYGLLGIIPDVSKRQISVDYRKSLCLLYCEIMKYYYRFDGEPWRRQPRDTKAILYFSLILQMSLLGPHEPHIDHKNWDFGGIPTTSLEELSIDVALFGIIKIVSTSVQDLNMKIQGYKAQPTKSNSQSKRYFKSVSQQIVRTLLPAFGKLPIERESGDVLEEWERQLRLWGQNAWGTFPLMSTEYIPEEEAKSLTMFVVETKKEKD